MTYASSQQIFVLLLQARVFVKKTTCNRTGARSACLRDSPQLVRPRNRGRQWRRGRQAIPKSLCDRPGSLQTRSRLLAKAEPAIKKGVSAPSLRTETPDLKFATRRLRQHPLQRTSLQVGEHAQEEGHADAVEHTEAEQLTFHAGGIGSSGGHGQGLGGHHL